MKRSKRAHSIGYLMGRYVVGPLILLVIVGVLIAVVVSLGVAIATGLQNMP